MCVQLSPSSNNNKSGTKEPMLFLQWHITAKCDQTCKHCYMYDSPFYKDECEKELTTSQCLSVIDDFVSTIECLSTKGGLVITGGDPLLRNDLFILIDYAKSKGIDLIALVGNSYHLHIKSVTKLKNHGVNFYQISLDGLKDTHDYFRKPGSFDDALRAFKLLKDANIQTGCMFTASNKNMNELLDVIRLVSDIGVTCFDFDRLVPVGNGKTLINELIDPLIYKKLLLEVNSEYLNLIAQGSKTIFGYKDNLWNLILDRNNQPKYTKDIIPEGFEIKTNCLIGKGVFAVLADGSVLACRRLPIKIGKLPEDKLLDIHLNSPILENLRRFEDISQCNQCEKSNSCSKGCRAVAYGYSGGDYFSMDPQCWRDKKESEVKIYEHC